ncbi:hypothetical protein BN14_09125 [Rhizoctonia solani AG-1 IB]|nr:hypothetical protein BN14_09125 [Rhizoctonia solani AG-1 IB]
MKTDSDSLFGNLRDDIHAASLELVGTILFLLLGLGGIQASAFSNQAFVGVATGASTANQIHSIPQLLYISASMGLSLLVSVWFFYR